MIIIVNTNRIIAAIIKDSLSRKIIYSNQLNLCTLNLSKFEIEKHKSEILEKSNLTNSEFEYLLIKVLNHLTTIKDEFVKIYLPEAKKIMDKIDKSDTQFIAAALAVNSPIWSDDNHFQQQNKIKIYKTRELAELINLL